MQRVRQVTQEVSYLPCQSGEEAADFPKRGCRVSCSGQQHREERSHPLLPRGYPCELQLTQTRWRSKKRVQ